MASEGSTGHSPASFSPDLAISAAFHSRNWEGRAEKVKKAQQASPMASAIWNFNSPAVSIPSRIRAVKKGIIVARAEAVLRAFAASGSSRTRLLMAQVWATQASRPAVTLPSHDGGRLMNPFSSTPGNRAFSSFRWRFSAPSRRWINPAGPGKPGSSRDS